MLSKLKITHKIYSMGVIQFLLIAVVGLVGYTQMSKIGVELVDIAERDIPLTNQLVQITEHQLQQAILFERAMFEGALQVLKHYSSDPDFQKLQDKHLQTFSVDSNYQVIENKLKALSVKTLQEIRATESFIQQSVEGLHTQQAKDKFQSLFKELKLIEISNNSLMKSFDVAFNLMTQGKALEASEVAHEIEKNQDIIDESLISLVHEVQKFTQEAALTAEHDEQSGIIQIVIWLLIALLFALILPYVIGQAITKPIHALNARLFQVAEGDGDLRMTLPENARDETGDTAKAFNLFLKKLRTIITEINHSAEQLGESSQLAIEVMEQTLQNVEKQRSETEQVATAVTEMNMTTQDVAKNTNQASDVAEGVRVKVAEGKIAAVSGHNIIEQLSDELGNASYIIGNLAEKTAGIGTVLETIRGIAEQTNLLALNAAIEAARAGETGRGFAVVADEVRNLAQRTQSSTVDIQQLVEALQSEAKNAVNGMDKGSVSADLCLTKSIETTQAFESASSAVNNISDLNVQIATAAEEQSSVAEEIDRNLLNIQQIAETTTEGAQKTSEANIAIAKRLIDLHVSLNQFQV
jgi:methyl-accepting chemotaxis protein